jgi:molybdenum cofactor biosynthesis enzyme MoaA
VFSNPSNRRINIRVTGSGDAIGSKIFRRLLTALDGASFPNLSIVLHTNGVLLTPRWWSRFRKIHGNIEKVDISIDAATPDTYAVTRRGGNWEVLQRNIRFLCEQGVHVIAGFVVQQANYREMPAFVRLARSLGASRVKFSLVLDWGTWDKEAYEKHCIWKSYHSEFPAFLETLRAPELADSMILWGNVAAYREYATSRQRTGAGTGVTRQATSFPPPGSTRNNNPRPGTP